MFEQSAAHCFATGEAESAFMADTPPPRPTPPTIPDAPHTAPPGGPNLRPVALFLSLAIHLGGGLFCIQQWYAPPTPPASQPQKIFITALAPPPPAAWQPPTLPAPPPASPKPSPGASARPAPSLPAPLSVSFASNAPAPASLATAASAETIEPVALPPLPVDPRDSSDSFEGRLLARIEQFRRYPWQAARQRQQGTTFVRFRMNRDGRVLDAAIDRSSGHPALDREALATIRRAEPLPEIPPHLPDEITVAVPVEFHLSATTR